MDIDYINEFIVLTEVPNLSEAAEKLNVSESSLSRHVKALEDELGCNLFERTSRTFRLSKYGRMFLPFARDMVSIRQRSMTVLHDAVVRENSAVTIVSNYYIGNYLAAFYQKHPTIATNLVDSPSYEDSVKAQLRNHVCTFAFMIDYHETSDEFESIPFLDDRFCVVVPDTHPLANEQRVPLELLKRENFVTFRSNSFGDIDQKKICHQAGFDPHVAITVDNGISIISCISKGMGVSLLHEKSIYTIGSNISRVKILETVPEHSFTVSLVYRKGIHFTPAEETFLAYCKEVATSKQRSKA